MAASHSLTLPGLPTISIPYLCDRSSRGPILRWSHTVRAAGPRRSAASHDFGPWNDPQGAYNTGRDPGIQLRIKSERIVLKMKSFLIFLFSVALSGRRIGRCQGGRLAADPRAASQWRGRCRANRRRLADRRTEDPLATGGRHRVCRRLREQGNGHPLSPRWRTGNRRGPRRSQRKGNVEIGISGQLLAVLYGGRRPAGGPGHRRRSRLHL